MWYPEEPLTYCRSCDTDIPLDQFWLGRGYIITGPGHQVRTTVLYSQCPQCGQRQSVGLEGARWYRLLYGWLWQLRYPNRRPPAPEVLVVDRPKRSAPGS